MYSVFSVVKHKENPRVERFTSLRQQLDYLPADRPGARITLAQERFEHVGWAVSGSFGKVPGQVVFPARVHVEQQPPNRLGRHLRLLAAVQRDQPRFQLVPFGNKLRHIGPVELLQQGLRNGIHSSYTTESTEHTEKTMLIVKIKIALLLTKNSLRSL